MAVVYTDVQALSAQFASLSQPRIDPFIARAQRQMNADYWGALYDDGVLYLAAHLLAEAERRSGQHGAITSMSADGVAASFAAPAAGTLPAQFASTQWGTQYYGLLQSLRYKTLHAV